MTIKRWYKVTAVTGTPLIRCHHTYGSDNWGTSLTGDATDHASTKENEALADVEVTGTGWISFEFTYSLMNKDAVNYFRLNDMNAGNHNNESITIASRNNATSADWPYMEITVTPDATSQVIMVGFY